MDRYQSTLLPQTNEPEEIKRAFLDLLAKINELSTPQSGSIPSGSVQAFAGSTAPNGWLLCDGSTVSRSTYSSLFSVIGTTWGIGDGSTTFTLPDFRGASLAGVGTSTGYTQNETIALGTKYNDQMQGHYHELFATTAFVLAGGASGKSAETPQTLMSSTSVRAAITDGTNGTPRTGTVTRGKIVGVNFIIKA